MIQSKYMVEVKKWSTLPATAPEPGLYAMSGCLYFVNGPGAAPCYVGALSAIDIVTVPTAAPVAAPVVPTSTGISERTLLQAIAIAQNPDLALRLAP